jgi:hypothetical protein
VASETPRCHGSVLCDDAIPADDRHAPLALDGRGRRDEQRVGGVDDLRRHVVGEEPDELDDGPAPAVMCAILMGNTLPMPAPHPFTGD